MKKNSNVIQTLLVIHSEVINKMKKKDENARKINAFVKRN